MNNSSLDLKKACKELVHDDSMIILCSSEQMNECKIDLVPMLIEKKRNSIYLSLNKPYSDIDRSLKKAKVDVKGIHYVDCITTLVHPSKPDLKDKRVLHVGSPAIVAEEGLLPEEIEKFINGVPKPSFIILDALRTLLLYNKPITVVTFMHHLVKAARELNAKLVVLTTQHGDEKIMKDILPLFDVILSCGNAEPIGEEEEF